MCGFNIDGREGGRKGNAGDAGERGFPFFAGVEFFGLDDDVVVDAEAGCAATAFDHAIHEFIRNGEALPAGGAAYI